MTVNLKYELSNVKIITKYDVLKLKKYIDIKFKNSTKKEQASILSNTIHNVLTNSLKCFEDDLKSDLKVAILKNTFFNNKNIISLYDILLVLTSVEFKNKIKIQDLSNWINSNLNIEITTQELHSYLGIESYDNKIEAFNKESATCNNIVDIDNEPLTDISSDVANIDSIKESEEIVHCNNDISIGRNIIKNYKFCRIAIISSLILLVVGFNFKKIVLLKNLSFNKKNIKLETKLKELSFDEYNAASGIPEYFDYKDINLVKLKSFLKEQNSLLAEDPYFSTIINSSKEFNLNPLILFSITGQEQSFVPKSQKSAKKIGNNPFNVFHSWKEYNTDIKDSSRIAARTVINLCKDRPPKEDPFQWINRKYAEDKNWWKGVKYFFEKLNETVK
ncbi:hypothetical protein BD780_000579 [Clostridium tetanomorphum]|uniref:Uncharacterized protein n=1 Tax=Clostridium tetanomorphum TaxID=1553 RepID=A0A923E784_CLOTT|nr:hypothetical protein [Clostridium tetanomorphum]KAJ51812.1 hypothetical protein CTM_11118 [Clostridium tetanomorphum DSM 665]MBC2397693.1 hypothetical protein [Clostridium tetanomorphum]MBP1865048.1 hypothetical protein [Clostridium tetanomorphum]NRS83354.1 hypothetical protein [Clostridium tetanomorphum]NRZ96554.1 hypothetical protein [Clostridium tetanomorphum]